MDFHSSLPARAALFVGVLAVGMAAAGLAGCSSTAPVVRRAPAPAIGPSVREGVVQGDAAWAGVFAPGNPALPAGYRLAAAGAGPEVSRLNGALSERSEATAFAQDAWPAPDRPSLWTARRLYLDESPRSFLYFDSQAPVRYRYRTRPHGWYGW